MDKKTFNNNIKIAFSNIGLQRNNKGEYFLLSNDNSFHLIIKPPDCTKGFILGVVPYQHKQNPVFKNSWLRNYSFELNLCFASNREYSFEEISSSVHLVVSSSKIITAGGKERLKKHLEEWVLVENLNKVKMWLDVPKTDEYSLDYMKEQVDLLKRGGFIVLTEKEFCCHRAFYSSYAQYGAKITFTNHSTVIISFYGKTTP